MGHFRTFNLTHTTNAVQHTLSTELERRTLQTDAMEVLSIKPQSNRNQLNRTAQLLVEKPRLAFSKSSSRRTTLSSCKNNSSSFSCISSSFVSSFRSSSWRARASPSRSACNNTTCLTPAQYRHNTQGYTDMTATLDTVRRLRLTTHNISENISVFRWKGEMGIYSGGTVINS